MSFFKTCHYCGSIQMCEGHASTLVIISELDVNIEVHQAFIIKICNSCIGY
jgi:hypothetical protein